MKQLLLTLILGLSSLLANGQIYQYTTDNRAGNVESTIMVTDDKVTVTRMGHTESFKIKDRMWSEAYQYILTRKGTWVIDKYNALYVPKKKGWDYWSFGQAKTIEVTPQGTPIETKPDRQVWHDWDPIPYDSLTQCDGLITWGYIPYKCEFVEFYNDRVEVWDENGQMVEAITADKVVQSGEDIWAYQLVSCNLCPEGEKEVWEIIAHIRTSQEKSEEEWVNYIR